jgi:hypothetical protein
MLLHDARTLVRTATWNFRASDESKRRADSFESNARYRRRISIPFRQSALKS